MIAAIWLRPVPSCCFVWNAADGGLQPISTTGGRDKRRGVYPLYRIVVIGFFACRSFVRSAATEAKCLKKMRFDRATCEFMGSRP